MRKACLILLLEVLLALPAAVMASDTLIVGSTILRTGLAPFSGLFVDSTGSLSIEQLLEAPPYFEKDFAHQQPSQFPQAYWVHIPVVVATPLEEALIVVPGDSLHDRVNHRLDYLDLYLVDEKGKIIRHERSGYFVPRSEKSLQEHPLQAVVPVSFKGGGRYDLYLRLQNIHTPQEQRLGLEIRHAQVGAPSLDLSGRWVILGPWGMFVIIGLFVLVFYFYVRDRAFLYFSIFCFLYSIDIICTEPDGGFIYLFPEHPIWPRHLFQASLFSVPFMLLFGNTFIEVKKNFPNWHKYYLGVVAVISLVVAAYFVRSFWPPYILHATGFLLSLVLIIPIGIRFIWSKNWTARIFAIGFFCFLGGNVVGVIAMVSGQTWGPVSWAFGQVSLLLIFASGLGYRLLEGERKQAQVEKIRELDHLKTRFFTNISHEFRTPLSLILGPLQNAEETVPASETENPATEIPVKAGHLQVMKRNAMRLQQLIDQILDLSKIESGKMKLQLGEGPVVKFVRSRVAEFADIAQRKHIHLVSNYSPENPTACFDPDKVEKILVNVLSNAVKFTPENGDIHINVLADKDHLSVSIADTGPGMSKADTDQIFDRFYQTDHAAQQGSGIGMALVKELVELHKGQIAVESQEGKGTTVSWKININPGSFPGQELHPDWIAGRKSSLEILDDHTPDQTGTETASRQESGQLILVVEDNFDLRQYIQEFLREDYRVIVAENGRQGKELAVEHLPDLIISDVMMPEMSGTEMAAQLKKEEKTSHIPIILLTAKSEQKDKYQGLATGADDYLTKPFDAKELRLKVANLIQIRKQLMEKYSQQPWKLPTQKLESLDEQFLRKVASVIQENLGNEYFSVEELGREIGYSRSQLFRKLKVLTGKSPLDLIREQRLHYAKELLQSKAVTVSEAAYQVGYSNLSYFAQSFRKEFGVLPSEV